MPPTPPPVADKATPNKQRKHPQQSRPAPPRRPEPAPPTPTDVLEQAAAAARAAAAAAKKVAAAVRQEVAGTSAEFGRPLPQDMRAERNAIGSAILQPALIGELPPARDFYHPVLGWTAAALRQIAESHAPEERITTPELQRTADALSGGLWTKHDAADPDWLFRVLEQATPYSFQADATKIRQLSQLRRQLELFEARCADIRERGAEQPRTVLESIERAIEDARDLAGDPRRAIERGSDVEIARAILDELRRGGEPLAHDAGRFWRYTPDLGTWQPVEDVDLERAIARFDGWMIGSGKAARPITISASRIRGSHYAAAVQAARRGWIVGADRPSGLCAANGFLQVSADGIEIRGHAPAHRATAALPYAYDAAAPCDRWIAFLNDVWAPDEDRAHKIAFLQEWTGAALTGAATRYGRAVILFGPRGRNGKGTASRVIRSIFPAGSTCSITPEQLEDDKGYHLAALAGKLLNWVSELAAAEMLHSERTKAAIVGETQTARFPGERPFEFDPITAHLLNSQKLPPVTDHSDGFFERYVVLTFNRYFENHERDTTLAERLERERAGIARWALEGAVRLMRRGHYEIPPSAGAALEGWKVRADPVRYWLQERATIGDGWTPSQELYNRFRSFCELSNFRPLSIVNFTDRLESAGAERRRATDANYWNVTVAA